MLSQMVLTEPSRLHWHAGKHSTHSVCPQAVESIPSPCPQPWSAQVPLPLALTSAPARPKAEGSRGTAVTAPSHDIGFALALPTLGLALGAERALGIAEAGCRQRVGSVSAAVGQGVGQGVERYSRSAPSCRTAERLCRRLEQGSATGEGPAACKGCAQWYRSKVSRRSMELGSPAMNISSEE